MFFGNADVDVVLAETRSFVGREAYGARRSGRNDNKAFVFLEALVQILEGDVIVSFAVAKVNGVFSGGDVERQIPVPFFFVCFRGEVTLAFGGVNMQHDRAGNVFDLPERFNQPGQGISLFHIAIFKTQGFEHVAFGRTACFAQKAQIGIKAAVVFGNRHLIVIDDDNDIAAKHGRIAEAFQGFAAA